MRRLFLFAWLLGPWVLVSQAGEKNDGESHGEKQARSAPATIEVRLPPSAELSFDGAATKQRGAVRKFLTPALAPAWGYSYKLSARWQSPDGKERHEDREIVVRAGQVTTVDLSPPSTEDIEGSYASEWFGLYLKDKKVGYVNTARGKVGADGDAVYREEMNLSMKLVSMGQKTEIKIRQQLDFDTKSPFALRRGHLSEWADKSRQTITLTRNGKGFEVVTLTGKDKRVRQIPAIDYTLADSMAAELWLKRGARAGDKITYPSFEIKDLETAAQTSKILAEKSSLVGGVKVEYLEVETFLHKDKLTTLFRHERSGRTLSGQIAIFEMRRETEEQAKNTEFSQDVFVLGQVKIQKELGRPQDVTGLVLEVKGAEKGTFKAGPRQSVAEGDGIATLKLGRRNGQPSKATKKEIEEGLRETTSYPIHDDQVKALAKQAIGDAKMPADQVKRLVNFVHNFVRPSLSAQRPLIAELLEHKQGDCKAYALLLTTLARAVGIPAREVSGLMYMGDDQKAFGGHAWNEVVLDGVWVPVDAAFNEPQIDATHISFGSDSGALGNMLKTLGKLSFRAVEVENRN